MASGDSTFLPQDVDYLGFLEAQLRDMQGIETLAYELIQNADDVQAGESEAGPPWIAFDVTAEALLVSNSGVFRPLDFARMQRLASGGKREEAGTMGAFGLGFLAVYQITDRPEILSGDRHWIIRPEALPEERIEERRVKTTDTLFRLPWAFDAGSPVRRRLRLPAIQPGELDDLATRLARAIEHAALFLRRLQQLEVRREGALLRQITRLVTDENVLHLEDETGRASRWLLLDGRYDEAAAQLRARYPWEIETTRESEVRLALPLEAPLRQGRLFAGLPTESSTPLPFHANADFYPTSDRKRIHLENGYQAAWNEAALTGAAELVAGNLERVREALRPTGFWQFLQQLSDTRQMAQNGDLPAIFAAFWNRVAPLLSQQAVVHTLQGEWRLPADTYLLERRPSEEMLRILQGLQLPLVHPDLAPYYALLRQEEIGVPLIAASDVATALRAAGLDRPTPLALAPSYLQTLDDLLALWQLIDPLLDRSPAVREQGLAALVPCAVVLTEAMMLERLDRVYRGSAEARALFPDVAWLHPFAPVDSFPGRFVPEFGVRQAVTLLAEALPDRLEEKWRLGRLDLPRLFRWFESRQIEIFADDPALARLIRRLPLGPIGGELRPLADLYIPGGFADPLEAAGLVELDELGGRAEFLRDLGMEELTFDAYLYEQLPRVLQNRPDLPSDARHRLLQLLAGRLGEFRDDEELREKLSALPLVPCMDGSFRPARSAYTEREARDLLGDRAHIAEPAESKAIAALEEWLGVRALPDSDELAVALREIGNAAQGNRLNPAILDRVWAIWRRLDALFVAGEIEQEWLAALRPREVIPDRDGVLRRPDQLAFAGEEGLAQRFAGAAGRFLSPDLAAAGVLKAAGVRPLSALVQARLTVSPDAVRLPVVEQRLVDRAYLIHRIVQAELGDGRGAAGSTLARLQVWRASSLQLEFRLSLGDAELASPPEPVGVWLDQPAGRLYVTESEAELPWLAIARELALTLRPGLPPGSLAIAIRDVLAAPDARAASRLLDELGYPPASS